MMNDKKKKSFAFFRKQGSFTLEKEVEPVDEKGITTSGRKALSLAGITEAELDKHRDTIISLLYFETKDKHYLSIAAAPAVLCIKDLKDAVERTFTLMMMSTNDQQTEKQNLDSTKWDLAIKDISAKIKSFSREIQRILDLDPNTHRSTMISIIRDEFTIIAKRFLSWGDENQKYFEPSHIKLRIEEHLSLFSSLCSGSNVTVTAVELKWIIWETVKLAYKGPKSEFVASCRDLVAKIRDFTTIVQNLDHTLFDSTEVNPVVQKVIIAGREIIENPESSVPECISGVTNLELKESYFELLYYIKKTLESLTGNHPDLKPYQVPKSRDSTEPVDVEKLFTKKNPKTVYDRDVKLGKGGFSTVFKAIHKKDKSSVAMKCLNREYSEQEFKVPYDSSVSNLLTELCMLKSCNHENIVQYFATFYFGGKITVIMEHCDACSLTDFINYNLEEELVAGVMQQIVSGIEYLHSYDILHRDLKSQNILLKTSGVIKIADLGLCKRTSVPKLGIAGTPIWMAPERLKKKPYGPSSDIWSLGSILYEMLEGVTPYAHKDATKLKVMFQIATQGGPALTKARSTECQDFLDSCWEIQPEDRAVASQLLMHPFLRFSCDPSRIKSRINEMREATEITGIVSFNM